MVDLAPQLQGYFTQNQNVSWLTTQNVEIYSEIPHKFLEQKLQFFPHGFAVLRKVISEENHEIELSSLSEQDKLREDVQQQNQQRGVPLDFREQQERYSQDLEQMELKLQQNKIELEYYRLKEQNLQQEREDALQKEKLLQQQKLLEQQQQNLREEQRLWQLKIQKQLDEQKLQFELEQQKHQLQMQLEKQLLLKEQQKLMQEHKRQIEQERLNFEKERLLQEQQRQTEQQRVLKEQEEERLRQQTSHQVLIQPLLSQNRERESLSSSSEGILKVAQNVSFSFYLAAVVLYVFSFNTKTRIHFSNNYYLCILWLSLSGTISFFMSISQKQLPAQCLKIFLFIEVCLFVLTLLQACFLYFPIFEDPSITFLYSLALSQIGSNLLLGAYLCRPKNQSSLIHRLLAYSSLVGITWIPFYLYIYMVEIKYSFNGLLVALGSQLISIIYIFLFYSLYKSYQRNLKIKILQDSSIMHYPIFFIFRVCHRS